jgi:cyclophilin family peptidyl-prolyl cis-trans isomerase
MTRQILLALFAAGSFLAGLALAQTPSPTPKVLMKTSKGDITIELYPAKAPLTVKNFLSYVKDKYYDGTIFHRVISNFMIQGGGLTAELHEKTSKDPIKNEAANGLKNVRGTIAMARTPEVDSATCQFFINLVDNPNLNHKDNTPDGFGYCVFGKVVSGMDVVDAIAKVRTGTRRGMGDVPLEPVTILSVEVLSGK